MKVIEIENSFEFEEVSYLKRIKIQILSDLWFIIIIVVLFMAMSGWKRGLILFSFIYLLNIIQVVQWVRYYLRKIVFEKDYVSIEYYYYNHKISKTFKYQGFQLEKKRLFYTNSAWHLELSFYGKKIFSQHILNNIFNREMIDKIISRFYSFKLQSLNQ